MPRQRPSLVLVLLVLTSAASLPGWVGAATVEPAAVPAPIKGRGATGRVPKFTGPGTIGNSSIFETEGNVGIGTTTPQGRLSLFGGTKLGGSSITNALQISSFGAITWPESGKPVFGLTRLDPFFVFFTMDASGDLYFPLFLGEKIARFAGSVNLGHGATWTSNGWYADLVLANAGAIAWDSNGSSTSGIGHTTDGLYFFRSGAVPGQTEFRANYDILIKNSGDVQFFHHLSQASASVTIDHPLAPETKVLSHSFVESPDMMNVYNGNAVTNEQGEAVVVLPAYFEALNKDFRYQLTVIGPDFAQAIVAREIRAHRFLIRTDKPGIKVSWQVTGIRRDAYANAHRIRVEEDKPATEQGFYLHPEEFGLPRERGIESAPPAPSEAASPIPPTQ